MKSMLMNGKIIRLNIQLNLDFFSLKIYFDWFLSPNFGSNSLYPFLYISQFETFSPSALSMPMAAIVVSLTSERYRRWLTPGSTGAEAPDFQITKWTRHLPERECLLELEVNIHNHKRRSYLRSRFRLLN